MDQKIHNLLGLMARSRSIDVGTAKIYTGMKIGKYKLVIVAADAEANTRERLETYAKNYQIELLTLGTKEELAAAVGKTLTVAIAIKDKGFSQSLIRLIK